MQQGEVWRVRLPFIAGREQAGERPAIIIANDAFLSDLPLVLVVPLTGEMAASRFAGTLVVEPDTKNGLTKPSIALVFQTRALDKRRLPDVDVSARRAAIISTHHRVSFSPK